MRKCEIFERVAIEWNREGITYAIAHGIEGYPDSLGRDLDVLVSEAEIQVALDIADSTLRDAGLTVGRPPALWGPRVIALDADGSNVIEIHLFESMYWHHVCLARAPTPSCRVGPFKIDPWASFVKRALLPLLNGQAARYATIARALHGTSAEHAYIVSRFSKLAGTRLARSTVALIRDGRPADLRAFAPRLRRRLLLAATLRHPLHSAARSVGSGVRRLRLPWHTCAPIVAFVGPDGSGKSTLIREISRRDRSVFLGVMVQHWRPHLLPPLGWWFGRKPSTPDTDGMLVPRRRPGRFRAFRLAYYYMDFLLGGYVKDNAASGRQILVLYDRCFLDMEVDPTRYGLANGKGVRALWMTLPRPDLLVLLRVDPATVHARKPELSVAEIQAQYEAWERLAREGVVKIVVMDGSTPIDQMALDARRLILENFVAKNAGARLKAG